MEFTHFLALGWFMKLCKLHANGLGSNVFKDSLGVQFFTFDLVLKARYDKCTKFAVFGLIKLKLIRL